MRDISYGVYIYILVCERERGICEYDACLCVDFSFRCISSFLLVCLFACLLAYWFRLLILGLKGPKVDRGIPKRSKQKCLMTIACDFICGRCWQPPLSNARRVSQRVKRCHPIRAASKFSQRSLCCFDLVSGKYLRWWSNLRWQGDYLCSCGGYHTLTTWTAWFRECWHRTIVLLSNHISYISCLWWSNGDGACWIHNLHKQKPQFIQEMWCALGLLSFVPTI